MTNCLKYLACVGLLAVLWPATPVAAGVTHKHENSQQKERLQDGSFAARDSHHHGDDGEHNADFDHEAILGSVKTAEEFDNLSPAESKKRLAVLVQKMDTNNDQFVDRHELKVWILRSFTQLSKEEAAERFEDIDTDRNDIITWNEYVAETYGSDFDVNQLDPLMQPHADEQNKLIADDKQMFETADVNKNGQLDPEEFVAFISPEEFPHMLPVILSQTLRDKDSDKDGKINFQEFIGDSGANQAKDWLVAEKDKFDTDLDLDGDGILNGNEILAWIVPSNDDVATDEVDHLFASSDENHDDRLSYQEIIDNSDTFVGSEATDYGDHLQNIHTFDDEL